MKNLNDIVFTGLEILVGFFLVLAVGLFLYGRPKLVQYQCLFEFERPPTKEERARTLAVLRERVRELAPPAWRASIHPQMDGRILLMYAKTGGGPGDLPETLARPAVCEFRLLHPDQTRLADAQKNGPPDGYEILNYLDTACGFDEDTGRPIHKEFPALVERKAVLRPASFRGVKFWTEGLAKFTYVRFEFQPDDAARLAQVAREHPNGSIAIIVDGVIRIAYRMREPHDGAIQFGDLLDIQEIGKLVKLLRTGPLPVPLKITRRMSYRLE